MIQNCKYQDCKRKFTYIFVYMFMHVSWGTWQHWVRRPSKRKTLLLQEREWEGLWLLRRMIIKSLDFHGLMEMHVSTWELNIYIYNGNKNMSVWYMFSWANVWAHKKMEERVDIWHFDNGKFENLYLYKAVLLNGGVGGVLNIH